MEEFNDRRAGEIESLTGGLFREPVSVDINRAVFDYDLLVLLGPVFPHEVAGYSGGNKYLFPGISGGPFLHFTHWLGALITSYKVIGTMETPIREVIEQAAGFVDIRMWTDPRSWFALFFARRAE